MSILIPFSNHTGAECVCVDIPCILDASLHLSTYVGASVGSHRRKFTDGFLRSTKYQHPSSALHDGLCVVWRVCFTLPAVCGMSMLLFLVVLYSKEMLRRGMVWYGMLAEIGVR